MIIPIIIAITAIISVGMVVFAVYYKIQEKKREGNTRRRKSSSASTGSSSSPTSQVKDSRELIKDIEDIEDGILITDDGTRFISAITCRGVNDFYDQSAYEQQMVMKGYRGFVNTITGPITYRMYTKELDMDYTIKKYSDKRDEFIKQYKHLEASLIGVPENNVAERNRIKEDMNSIRFRIQHLTAQMDAVGYYSSSAVAMEQMQDYIFEWKYRAGDFDTDLTPAERLARAKAELEVAASAKIAALASAGVKARVCTQGEMIDMCRRVSQPISAERFRMKELDASSYFDDIVTSDSMERMGYVVAEEAGEKSRALFNNLFVEQEPEEKPVVKESEVEKKAPVSNTAGAVDGEEVFTFGEE